ncbi:anthranilate phosphoribosyltransferase [Paenibacillus sp.]|uniref:anthranilate phosphoribosyltransferase n=1 Tax=Paenibacillus sp. TaxID=58172 RepID=UPI002D3262CE|nr:anthranilate phosphoribosyltransferase [Paenibacillus sp.]HZG57455.1 anthranilate phosphoribosyltransferase [Paenibacillus sp.]
MSEKTVLQRALASLLDGASLTREEAQRVMESIMDGEATPAQIGALLAAMRMKGETADEVAGFAAGMRAKVNRVETVQEGLLDTCGTGGDGMHTFNISTASAIVAAAGGVRVAKHGNRAMSSKSGSADVLEALGVNISLGGEQAAACLREVGLCFMFAQVYHPSMRHAAAPRRELGVRTVFNLLGPLTNPAGADRQLLGVFDRSKTELMAEVLRELGTARALVVGSHDGLDEISLSAPTRVTELKDGKLRTYDITPDDLGLRACGVEDIAGGDAAENAETIRIVFAGARGPYRDIVLANAGACFYVAGLSGTLQEGVKRAADAIDSGAASRKLEHLVKTTGALSHVSG